MPIEINLQNIRIAKQDDLPIEDYWNTLFDELNEQEEERLSVLERLIQQKESIAKSYNRQVKSKLFNVDDLVWKVLLLIDKSQEHLKSGPQIGKDLLKLKRYKKCICTSRH